MNPERPIDPTVRTPVVLTRRARIADAIAFGVFVLMQAGGVFVCCMSTFAIAMWTDPCGYEDCGDPAWIDRAMWVVWTSVIPAGAMSLFGVIRLARNKIASWAPLAGLVMQVTMLAAGWWMAGKAGPIK